jgi:hypothetical protein
MVAIDKTIEWLSKISNLRNANKLPAMFIINSIDTQSQIEMPLLTSIGKKSEPKAQYTGEIEKLRNSIRIRFFFIEVG